MRERENREGKNGFAGGLDSSSTVTFVRMAASVVEHGAYGNAKCGNYSRGMSAATKNERTVIQKLAEGGTRQRSHQ